MHLVESNRKKCAFLAEVARETKAPVDIHAMRIEGLAESAHSLMPDVVSARALAPLPRLFELAARSSGRDQGAVLERPRGGSEIEAAKRRFGLRPAVSIEA